jgi:hypothetical protein
METPRQSSPTWMWIGIVALGASARLLPHPWNFTPLVAAGLFAGTRARGIGAGALVTLLSLAISDIALGFSRDALFVYPAALIPVLLGRMMRNRGWAGIPAAALASSVSFFLITNFMTWAIRDIYPHTMAGLSACYIAGIPFYANQLAGDAFYTAVMFGGYSLLTRKLPRIPEPWTA